MFVMLDLISTYRHAAQMRRGFLYLLRLHEVLLSPALKAGVSAPLFLAELRYCKALLARRVNHPASVGQAKVGKRQLAGFTLLELLVVITLLGVVMLTATTFIVNTGETERDESTSIKWHQLRTAIIGDSTRTLNGAPVLSGYVADMGRLPANIKELMSKDYDYDHDVDLATDYLPIEQPAWKEYDLGTIFPGLAVPDTALTGKPGSAKLAGGWRGPYLYSAGSKIFSDGWGFVDTDYFRDADNQFILDAQGYKILKDSVNFNWRVVHEPLPVPSTGPTCNSVDDLESDINDCDGLQIQSLGEDHVLDDPSLNIVDYRRDFPHADVKMVVANEWTLNGASISFLIRLNKPPTAGSKLQLRLYHFQDGIAVDSEDGTIVQKLSSAVLTTDVDTDYMVTFTPIAPSAAIKLPMGRYAAAVWCVDDPDTMPVEPTSVYDGDCSSAPVLPIASPIHSPYYFTLLPSSMSPPIVIPWSF